jgi:hypothetical protein
MTITVDSLLPRRKLDCDGCYNVVVKGPSVVVLASLDRGYIVEARALVHFRT